VFGAVALLAGAYVIAGPTSAAGENFLAFAIFLGAVALALRSLADGGPRATPVHVSASSDGLVLDVTTVATPQQIRRVQILETGRAPDAVDHVHFELESGTLALAVPRDRVEPLLAALAVQPEDRSAAFRLKLPLLLRLGALGVLALPLAIWTAKPAPLITFSLILLAFLLRYLPGRALVGVDGVRIGWGPFERFVPHAAIKSVQALGDSTTTVGVALELQDPTTGEPTGKTQHLYAAPALYRVQLSDGLRLATQIKRAHGGFLRGASRDEDLHARLARGDRSAAEWLSALRQASARADYRSVALGSEQLIGVLDSPDSPAESRIAAAAILRAQEDGPARVRVAARRAAAPGVDAALEELARAESDEETLAALQRFVERGETPG
jgi:hypothetical protein